MSRLIDADKLLEELKEYHPLSLSYGILSDIEYFPTAYDIDKVIELLQDNAIKYRNNALDELESNGITLTFKSSIGKMRGLLLAIKIVKKGGAE